MDNDVKDYLCTFSFYGEDGRRLSIFAREIEGNKMEIFLWKCSKKDRLDKKVARAIYEKYRKCPECGSGVKYVGVVFTNKGRIKRYRAHPQIFEVSEYDYNFKHAFKSYCTNLFYRKVTMRKFYNRDCIITNKGKPVWIGGAYEASKSSSHRTLSNF